LRRLVVLSTFLFAGAVGTLGMSHVTPALADQGGNSSAAHACQQGGYATLFGSDGTGFKNAGECTSYAAHGGTLSTALITFIESACTGRFAIITITGVGLAPYTPVTVQTLNGPALLGYTDASGNIMFIAGTFPTALSLYFTGTAANGSPYTSPTYAETAC
jgi:hypothetical protein